MNANEIMNRKYRDAAARFVTAASYVARNLQNAAERVQSAMDENDWNSEAVRGTVWSATRDGMPGSMENDVVVAAAKIDAIYQMMCQLTKEL